MYGIKYELSDGVVGNYKTIKAAFRKLQRCLKAAKRGGDKQRISLVRLDGQLLSDEEQTEKEEIRMN